ncbi:MAG TPA: glycosyltransferase family 4 protein [Trichormus sp. M33_DOE_039]|nr:glycosyltransferase family 4 protein [Trichormus sp. M33_DOE_039]
MEKYKILFISNIFPPHVRGGYELGCLELAEKYTNLGHSVIVASSENTPDLKKYPEPQHIDVRRIFSPVKYYDDNYNYHFQKNSIYLYEKIMAFAGYLEYNCIALRRLIELEKPDIVWIFNPLGIGPLGILDTVLSCKAKVVIHLMEHIDGVIQDHSKVVNLTAKWKYLKSQITAISCSQKILDSSSKLGEYHSNNLIYNWIDFNKYSHHISNVNIATHQRYGDTFNLVYFGQLAQKKGVGLLFELAKYISKSPYNHKISIDLYGGGEKKFVDWLKKEISHDESLSKIFHLKGFLPKESLLENISQYDMAVFPLSDDEPFGYAPIEAMLTGVPVMITSKTGVSELLQDGYNAILIKNRNNIPQFYKKIVWCIENQSELEKIRENAIITIKENFDLDMVTVPALNELIAEIVPSQGYSFDHILTVCETLKYPYFELSVKNHLVGARYKFIDKVVDFLYQYPLLGKNLQNIVRYLLQKRRNNI